MKNFKYLAIIIGLGIIGCTDDTNENEIERLNMENQKLQEELVQKDSTLYVFEESFTSIQRNLALISEREVAISVRSGELQLTADNRNEITKDIQAINNLLEDNKKTIARLNNRIAQYGADVSGFKKLVEQLQTDIRSKEEQIKYIKENLTAANFTVDILNEMLDSAEFRSEVQSGMIKMTVDELYTAYYAVGTYRDLQKNDVLIKEGSIVGIAGSKTLKPDFNKDYFEQISTRETRVIPLNSKKADVITNHPTSSYELIGEEEKTLRILDIERFWSASKYLVVVTD
jgi:predicted RNase H-like nuclease (RuvC/YqgF family)